MSSTSKFLRIEGNEYLQRDRQDVPSPDGMVEVLYDTFRAWDERNAGDNSRLRAMSYREYLQTPEWSDTRRRKLCAAGWRCERCQTRFYLQVHHRTYENFGFEELEDLEVLCRNCHRQEHGM